MTESVRPAADAGLPAAAVYALGSSKGESARLRRQAEELAADSATLLNRVAAMEPDTEYAMCYPPHPAFTRICEIFPVVFGRDGADPHIGRRVPELFRQAGLTDVGMEARPQLYPPGNSRRTIRLDLVRSMRARVLEMGLADEAELEELDAAARAHLEDPRTVAMSGLLYLVWGRRSAKARGS